MVKCKSKKGNQFTLKEYRKNEDINYNTENTVELVKKFGTKIELKTILAIERSEKYYERIFEEDYLTRYKLNSKYFKCFFKK